MSLTGTDHCITSAYHLQSNGPVLHFNQTLQNSLRKCSTKSSEEWDTLLPSVLFAMRTSVQKSTKYTPFQNDVQQVQSHFFSLTILLYGYRQPVLPIEMELKGEGDGGEEYGVEIDDIVAKMTEVLQKVFQSASQNIKNAQV